MKQELARQAMTVAIAAAGVAVFHLLSLPLPFLFGPMAASLVAALLGARLTGLGQVSVGARAVLGVAIGASVTPALVAQVPAMMASVALVPIYILIIGAVGYGQMGFFFSLPLAIILLALGVPSILKDKPGR